MSKTEVKYRVSVDNRVVLSVPIHEHYVEQENERLQNLLRDWVKEDYEDYKSRGDVKIHLVWIADINGVAATDYKDLMAEYLA